MRPAHSGESPLLQYTGFSSFVSPFLASGLYPIHSEGKLGKVGLDGSMGREARL